MLFGSSPSYDSLRVLDVSILLFFKIMKETNLSLVLVCIVFLGMELVKKCYRRYDLISKCLHVSQPVVF